MRFKFRITEKAGLVFNMILSKILILILILLKKTSVHCADTALPPPTARLAATVHTRQTSASTLQILPSPRPFKTLFALINLLIVDIH